MLINENTDVMWFLQADEDELFAKLGRQLLGDGLGVGPDDEDESQRFGKAWFDSRVTEFRTVVCAHPFVKELSGDLTGDLVDIAALVLPFVGNHQLLALTVSGIIVRRGVTAFCQLGQS